MVNRDCGFYRSPRERAAMRCALRDAASICDMKINEFMKIKRPTKKDEAIRVALLEIANLLWTMREKIEVPHE